MKIIHLLLFSSIAVAIQAQDDIPKVPMGYDYVETNVTSSELKEELIGTVQRMVNEYAYAGTFYDYDLGAASDEKISQFSDLFADDARIFNFLSVDNPQMVSFSDFTNEFYTYYYGQKFDFELINAELKKLNEGPNGNYYYGTITFEMKQYSGLDSKKSIKYFPRGSINDLTMEIRIYPYDTSIGEIIALEGETRADVRIDKVALFDAHIGGGIGFLTASIDDAYIDALGSLSTSATTLGVDALYRKSINYDQTLYLAIGFNAQALSLTTGLNDYYSFDNDNLAITSVDGNRLAVEDSKVSGTQDPFSNSGSDNTANQAFGYAYQIRDGQEQNRGMRIGVPIGVSYRVYKPVGSDTRFFVDLLAIPSYIIWNNSTVDGSLDYVKVPEFNFPDRNILAGRLYSADPTGRINGATESQYLGSYEIGGAEAKGLSPASTFDLDIMLSPTYKRLIGAQWGFSIGMDIRMNILNLFSSSSYQGDFLEGDLSNFADRRERSIHEDLITSNRLFNTSLKVGFFRELD